MHSLNTATQVTSIGSNLCAEEVYNRICGTWNMPHTIFTAGSNRLHNHDSRNRV